MRITEPVQQVIVDVTQPGTFVRLADGGWLKRMADGTLHAGKDLILVPIKDNPKNIGTIGVCAIAGAAVLTAGALLYLGDKVINRNKDQK